MVRHQDGTSVSLLFANHTPDDVLIKNKIDELAKHSKSDFNVNYIVSKVDNHNWSGLRGHITKELLKKLLPKPSDDTLIMFCGPMKLNNFIVDNLLELGYTVEMMAKF